MASPCVPAGGCYLSTHLSPEGASPGRSSPPYSGSSTDPAGSPDPDSGRTARNTDVMRISLFVSDFQSNQNNTNQL